MKVEARTPTRIDLAGGTLDIYPLYLFEDGGLTVNLAISLYSNVVVEKLEGTQVILESEDFEERVEAASAHELKLHDKLDLLARAVKFYAPSGGVHVRTRNTTPRGSGLGASSSLLMALSGALARVAGQPGTPDDYIDWGANLEAQSIAIPTGKQDYYAAIYGGALAIEFDVKGGVAHRLPLSEATIRELESRAILTFTGVSHFSGTNNWNMMKRYIDHAGDTVERLRGIKQTALKMREVLTRGDVDALAGVLDEEWQNRRGLAEGVSTPDIDRMTASAREAGALASKLCGAGGGGCMVTIAGRGKEQAVRQALQASGAQILDWKLDTAGLLVQVLDPSAC
ncbi:MAG: GHMP family kinase ATP-binding protein [Candidatus Xenobia bacterium]